LRIQNNSKQAAVWVETCFLKHGSRGSCGAGAGRGHAILPGAVWEEEAGGGGDPEPDPVVVVEGAVFEDGTSEGPRETFGLGLTEEIDARLAYQIQNRRIRDILRRILADAGTDDAEKAAQIRATVLNLSDTLDEVSLASVRRRIDVLPAEKWRVVQDKAAIYLHGQKQNVLKALDAFERERAGRSLAEWWNEWSRTM
jgi:hypothetical protein